jgi:hypothetical protein
VVHDALNAPRGIASLRDLLAQKKVCVRTVE